MPILFAVIVLPIAIVVAKLVAFKLPESTRSVRLELGSKGVVVLKKIPFAPNKDTSKLVLPPTVIELLIVPGCVPDKSLVKIY